MTLPVGATLSRIRERVLRGSRVLRRILLRIVLAAAFASVAAVVFGAPAEAKPARIVSINLCTDQFVLALADRERIRSLSYLVAEPDESPAVEQARGLLLNHGRSEQILPLEPDLIVAGLYSPRPTRLLLRRLGYDVVEFGLSNSLADVRDRIRQKGEALGETQRAEALIRTFDARLDAARPDADGPRPTALYLQPGGYTSGRNSLIDDIIVQAGLINLGAQFGFEGPGRAPLESMLAADPDILITQEEKPRVPALAYDVLNHPAIAALTARAHRVTVPMRYWICGVPETLRAVEILAEARRRVVADAEQGVVAEAGQ
ncbi:MAG: ABC transporter substrate-binding protein [Rhodospirillales bacterium]|nr:ABC transporter substrate-binding protein [Rhodospirillales bacterium]